MNKKTVTYTLPVHVGFFVLQYAKMRMLQFYYDFINITSGTAPNGCRPNVATTIGTSTCAVDSPIDRGSATRRALRRAGRTTIGHLVCSRWSCPATGSWGCAARRTIVSDPPTNTAPKD